MNIPIEGAQRFSLVPMRASLRRWTANAPRGHFWIFFAAWIFFTLGFSIFYFLFNIYLIGFGWTEQTLGYIGSLMAAGSILGTIPTGKLIERIGLRLTLMLGAALAAGLSVLRVFLIWQPLQLGLALLGGIAMCSWAVCLPPVIAAVAKEEQRPFAFSLMFSSGIGLAGVGGLVSGNLPGLLRNSAWSQRLAGHMLSVMQADRATLLAGCCVAALALIPLSQIALPMPTRQVRQARVRNQFLWSFLPAIAIWGLVTGAFAPFANVYFVHHLGVSLERTGTIFSFSQLVQFAAILSAPLLFRRMGLATGIMCTQLATAVSLGLLSISRTVPFAATIYCTYMAAQYMNEPGIYSLLMARTTEKQRSSASAATLFVTAAAQALAALGMGWAIVHFGYSASISAVAVFAVVAAALFRRLSRISVESHSDVSGEAATEPML